MRPLAAGLILSALHAQPALPPLRQQADLQQEWLKLRLERVLPGLMRKHGMEMWLVISSEYNEDPVFRSLDSPTTFAARRRTIYVFHDRGAVGVDRLALGGVSQGGLYTVYRETGAAATTEPVGDAQWQHLLPRQERFHLVK